MVILTAILVGFYPTSARLAAAADRLVDFKEIWARITRQSYAEAEFTSS